MEDTAAATPEPATPAPISTPQLENLRATRDRLEAKTTRTPAENQRITALNDQIAKAERTEAARRARNEPPQSRDRGGPAGLREYKFNNGVSVWRQVFAEAGYDPNTATSMPIKRQSEILSQHMQDKFGFTNVEVVGYRNQTATPVDHFHAVNAMLDMTRAITDAMAGLGLPHTAASLDGRLSLVLEPKSKNNAFGAYEHSGVIHIKGGANSFGHEWTHAVDHLLAERFTNNPSQMNKLLSQYARHSGLDVQDNVQAAFAKLINTLFYEDAALAARRLNLEMTSHQTDKAGNPTKRALEARDQLARLEGGGSKLRIQSSEFRELSATFNPRKSDYYAAVYEMIARSHEAYSRTPMTQDGKDPRGIVMPDEAYTNATDRALHMLYPNDPERIEIFRAFDELHEAIRNEMVLSGGKPPGDFSNLGVSDPHYWRKTVPQALGTRVSLAVRQEINSYKNFTKSLADRAGIFDKDRPPGPRNLARRAVDANRAFYKSKHSMMKIMIERAPDQAKPILQDLLDRLATDPGIGPAHAAELRGTGHQRDPEIDLPLRQHAGDRRVSSI